MKEQGWLRMKKIDTDKKTKLKRLAKLFKPFNRDWVPLKMAQPNKNDNLVEN